MNWLRFWTTLHVAAAWRPPQDVRYGLGIEPATRSIMATLEIDGIDVTLMIPTRWPWLKLYAALDASAAELLDVYHAHARQIREPIYPHPAERN